MRYIVTHLAVVDEATGHNSFQQVSSILANPSRAIATCRSELRAMTGGAPAEVNVVALNVAVANDMMIDRPVQQALKGSSQ